jgi:hypothetical protein
MLVTTIKRGTPNNWKHVHDIVGCVILYAVLYIPQEGLCLENTQGNLQFWMPSSNSETGGGGGGSEMV